MKGKLLFIAVTVLILGSATVFADRLWIVGREAGPGDLVTVDVWLRYTGAGPDDSISAFDIPFTWDASVCSVEAITLGYPFRKAGWIDVSQIDNQGILGPPSIPKLSLSAYKLESGQCGPRGDRNAGRIDFRMLESVVPPESTCLDTLMQAFSPPVNLRFVDKLGMNTYVPSFTADCIRYYTFADSLWVVGGKGYPGELLDIEVWLQYEGAGPGDSISSFDILLTWDAAVCTVEAMKLGPDWLGWDDYWSQIDNQGTQGPPAAAKVDICGWANWIWGVPFVCRGTHLAATLDARILSTATAGNSTCFDTLMQAFTPTAYLCFVGEDHSTSYFPSFSGDCIQVIEYYCGDANADGRISSADIVYLGNYIYRVGPEPYGQGDVNLDGRVTVADAIYLGHYIYRRGPEPCSP